MAGASPMRIVIVDDDRQILKGLSSMLARGGLNFSYKLITCDNAFDALEVLAAGADLVITDLEMPGMGGLDLIGQARARGYCERFIVLTGYASFEFAQQAIRHRVNDYLLKPVNKQELFALLEKAAEQLDAAPAEGGPALPALPGFAADPPENCSGRLRRVLAYIDQNLTRDISLGALSEAVGITPSYICVLFQQEMGTTFLAHLDGVRLKRSAALLLQNPGMVVRQVAQACGFMNERHFYKVFKKRLGLTPGEFREQYGAGATA